jgi:hypothetical protein
VPVRQHDKTLGDQRLGCAHQLFDVGIEELAIADHLELDPVGLQRFTRQMRGQHRVLGGLAACGIGQEMHSAGEQIDDALVVAGKADPTDRRRHHLGAARGHGVEHELAVGIARGAEKQP